MRNDPLERYGFRDELGHSLHSIVEYQHMCEIVEAAQWLLKMRDLGSRDAVMAATQVLVEATEQFNQGLEYVAAARLEGE